MFAYHEMFDCPRSLLLYPTATAESHHYPRGRFVGRDHLCSLAFLSMSGDPRSDLRELLHAAAAALR